MKQMIIFHVLKYTLNGAGNACAAVDLACVQADRGHQVYVCSAAGDFTQLLTKHGVKFVELDQSGSISARALAMFKLYHLLMAIKPDIVHAHMMGSTLMAAALRPLVGYGLVTSVHNEFQRSAILMRLGQRVIGVSEAVSQSMIARGVPKHKMRTVLNGTIQSPRRAVPCPPPMALPRPAIVSVCGMHPRKGVPDLIAAFTVAGREFPDLQLFLAGAGPMLEEYKALGAASCGNRITFLGLLDDPRPLMMGADIFVLASHAEPAPLVLSEAREAGCAVVGTNVGGIPEMLEYGRAGLLVPPQRPDVLAETLLKLLRDRAYLAEMRSNSQINIEKMTMRRVAEDVEKVYLELALNPKLQPNREMGSLKL